MASRAVEAIDAYQRRHRWLGFPIAVVYKFGDDQGPYLTALITYYGFLSLFPLLLLLVTILGFVLQGDPPPAGEVVNSTLAELPIIGSQLRENVHSLKGSGIGLAIGILGTLYGCLGAAGATQNAFNRAWAVPRNKRPNPLALRLRSLLLLLVLGAGVLVTTALSGLTPRPAPSARPWAPGCASPRSRWPRSPTSDSSCSRSACSPPARWLRGICASAPSWPASAGRSCRYSAPTSSRMC